MIKNIIFDMGQVLIHWSPDMFLDRYALTEEDRLLLKRELYASIEWVQLDHGTITEDEALERICGRLPQRLHGTARELVTGWWIPPLDPMEGMEELIRELKKEGYRLFVLSNAGLSLRGYCTRLPGADCFDGVLVSAEEKLLKPQLEIFRTLMQRYSLAAEDCVFIDDLPANCEGAVCAGLRACIFRGDVGLLRKELRRMGLRCHE